MIRTVLISLTLMALLACSGNQLKPIARDMCDCMIPYVKADKAWMAIARDTTQSDDIRLATARERTSKRSDMEQCMTNLQAKYKGVSFSGRGEELQNLLKENCPDAFDYFGLQNEVGE